MVCNALRKQSIIDIMEVIKMKKSDLHREWARVLDMCEGTNVNPEDCWKIGARRPGIVPRFCEDLERYEFAAAILEGKPLFVGDKVWSKLLDDWYIITDGTVNFHDMSWNPPKKTFLLNGVELPCATTKQGGEVMIIKVGNQEYYFMFESGKDADKVMTSIYNLLIGSTK